MRERKKKTREEKTSLSLDLIDLSP